jgi:steroid 5-alpha reductase family enzyme
MDFLMVSLLVVAAILLYSLIYTWLLAKRQKDVDVIDTPIPKAVQAHSYLSNPIFLTYGIFFALLLLIIVFVSIYFF